MEKYEKNLIPHIESIYEEFTPLEKTIADFFIKNPQEKNLSAKHVSKKLFVSEASISRFAQKCGFRGYREFLFRYQQGEKTVSHTAASGQIKAVMNSYQDILNKSYSLMDEKQMDRIVEILSSKKKIFVYGMGSSGLVGMEMKLRFMRIGLNMEAITDSHIMRMNSVLLDEECAVIGISVSGKTQEVINSLRSAKRSGAAVILMTSRMEQRFKEFCNEVVLIAVRENLEQGKAISPQFPILIMVDMIFSRILQSDHARRELLHDYTLEALEEKRGSDPQRKINSSERGV